MRLLLLDLHRALGSERLWVLNRTLRLRPGVGEGVAPQGLRRVVRSSRGNRQPNLRLLGHTILHNPHDTRPIGSVDGPLLAVGDTTLVLLDELLGLPDILRSHGRRVDRTGARRERRPEDLPSGIRCRRRCGRRVGEPFAGAGRRGECDRDNKQSDDELGHGGSLFPVP